MNEIQKKTDKVKLVFENKRTKKAYTMVFDGFLLETSGSALEKRVKDVQLSQVLGFRTRSQVQTLHKNPHDYQQILIQMEGSTEDYKLELLGAFRNNYRLSSKSMTPTARL